MRRLVLLLVILLSTSFAACTATRGDGDPGGDPHDPGDPAIPGIETLGRMCFGACGAADSRKCSIGSPDCASDLCLVDPSSDLINYCTVDCTRRPCPAGWRCEPIQAFGHPDVTSACVAEPAACGDGITQLGETCDGDDPAFGRCVDCGRWEASCGDGAIQSPEVCDGDTAEAYCAPGCGSLIPPSFSFTVHDRVASAVDRVSGPSTYFYGTGFEFGELHTGTLPQAGDADGCGAVRVLETTPELTRLEWTYCDPDRTAASTWTFAIPRIEVTHDDWDAPIPPQFDATVVLRKLDEDRHLEWTMAHMERFAVRVWMTAPPAHVRGTIQFRLEQPDPIQSFSTASAELDLEFEMTHPVLPRP
jgi:hypothetical protein